ncbi:hypothetical protein [Methylobacterium iners]|uniref:hypothetical protein n=1 Tax=Methylobacterium iners TaxID=418707 RepID=UPI001EE2E0D0|nr:hypothetical protein [Methylobacterium iners]
MPSDPTIGESFKVTATADIHLDAVASFFADPTTSLFLMGQGYGVNLAAAVAASHFATEMAADQEEKLTSRRAAVRSAILLARPMRS